MSGPGRWSHTHALLWLGPFHCLRPSVKYTSWLHLLLQLLSKWGSDWLLHIWTGTINEKGFKAHRNFSSNTNMWLWTPPHMGQQPFKSRSHHQTLNVESAAFCPQFRCQWDPCVCGFHSPCITASVWYKRGVCGHHWGLAPPPRICILNHFKFVRCAFIWL